MTCLSPLVALERIGLTKSVKDKVRDKSQGIPTDRKKYREVMGKTKPDTAWIFLRPDVPIENQVKLINTRKPPTPVLNKHEAAYLRETAPVAQNLRYEYNKHGQHRYIRPTLKAGQTFRIEYKDEKVTVQVRHVPCQQCDPCRQASRDAWKTRIKLEYETAQTLGLPAHFITLTFNEGAINHKDGYRKRLFYKEVRLFLARLYKYAMRKQAPRMPVSGYYSDGGTGTTTLVEYPLFRYFIVGEYGDQKHRAHYHLVLFGINFHDRQLKFDPQDPTKSHETSATLDALWGYGNCHIGTVTPESIAYCAAYIAKEHRFDPSSFRYPHFIRNLKDKHKLNKPMTYDEYVNNECNLKLANPLSPEDFAKLNLGEDEKTIKDRRYFLYLPYHQLIRDGHDHDALVQLGREYVNSPFSDEGQQFKRLCELRRNEFAQASTQPPLGFYWLAMQNVDRLLKLGKISLKETDPITKRLFVEKPLSRSILNMLVSPKMREVQNLTLDQWLERAEKIDKLKAQVIQDVEDKFNEFNALGTTPRLNAVKSQRAKEERRAQKQLRRKAEVIHSPRPTLD